MARIVECVPNFSEGRRPDVVDKIVAEITAIPGATLLSKELDADHNRAVITFIGSPEACAKAAVAACVKATELIDLNTHSGEHPRMGATDVVPFVPIQGVTMEECVALAKRVAQEISDRLAIPTFLYEYAATDPSRQNLAKIRGKGFEEMRDVIGKSAEKSPDFGPKQVHRTAGSTAVGARDFLIAYNIYLNTNDIEIAKTIAKGIRASSGGFAFVKAAGFEIKDRGCVQVSMNLTSPAKTPMFRVFETVKREAARYGVNVTSSEVVGMAPLFAVSDAAEYFLQIERWKPSQIIETALLGQETMAGFLENLASREPTPGGGSASAYAGALGAALCSMVGRLNDKKSGDHGPLHDSIAPAEALMGRLNSLVREDAESFNAVVASWKLPDTDPNKDSAKQAAQLIATLTPLETMERAVEVMKMAVVGLEKSKKSCLSDAGVAAFMAHACLEGARLNVLINLPEIKDEKKRAEIKTKADALREEAKRIRASVDKALDTSY
ncbi:MAG: glutamate formimidoyltransferase [Planctomycetes bacterium]|nr:glutamate formimidoyltransferase [Planctomycetota bacterium]